MEKKENRGWGRKSLLLGTTLCLILSGCQQKLPQKEEENAADKSTVEKGTKEAASVWNEKWQVPYTEDEDYSFDIDIWMKGFVITPENKPDSIVEVKEMEFDSQYKERFVKTVFDDGAYLYGISHMTKAALAKELEESKENLASCNEQIEELLKFKAIDERFMGIAGAYGFSASYRTGLIENLKSARKKRKFLKKKIESIRTGLKNAPDALAPVPAVDGEYDCDSYLGYINGIAYKLEFNWQKSEKIVPWEEDWKFEDRQTVTLAPLDGRNVAPEEFASADDIFYSGGHKETENRCSLTNAEALEKARDFLKKLGFDNVVETSVEDMIWTDNPDSQAGILEGYRIFFEAGMKGIPFISEGANPLPVNKIDHPIGEDFAEVCVSEDGVVAFHLNAPLEVKSITPDVKLLDFKDIQDMLRTHMAEYIQEIIQYEQKDTSTDVSSKIGDGIQVRKIELCYCKLEDSERKGEYAFVPAWKLHKFMVISAIDGSFIST